MNQPPHSCRTTCLQVLLTPSWQSISGRPGMGIPTTVHSLNSVSGPEVALEAAYETQSDPPFELVPGVAECD